jgi:phosphate transport system substrate-binding protein
VTGTGSSYAAVAINNWTGQVSNLLGLSINFQTQSSVLGLDAFALGQVDFGASEIGYSAGQSSPVAPPGGMQYQYLPDVAGATCLMYNVPSSTQQPIQNLQLNADILEGIFTGAITHWNDPRIAAINPGVALPNHTIVSVIRSDASGDNYIFSWYLSQMQPTQWQQYIDALHFQLAQAGNPRTAMWPLPTSGSTATTSAGTNLNFSTFNSQAGSDNASNYVDSTPYSITYVETAYAILHGKPCAAIQNASGNFVQPSSDADAIALTHDQLNAQDYYSQDLSQVFTAPEGAAYPISAYSYLVTQTAGINSAKAKTLGKFISFLACQGQISAGQLGYAPLPPTLVQVDFQAISRLPGADAPPPLDGQHCQNPYLTGAASYVGGPEISGGSGGAGASSSAAVGGVKAVSADSLSKKLLSKKKGTLAAAPGQTLGVALNGEAAGLLKKPASFWLFAGLTFVFLGLLIAPPAVMYLRKKRAAAQANQIAEEGESK